MSKERLSKLQKWMLCRCMENKKRNDEKWGGDCRPHIYYGEIYRDFFSLPYGSRGYTIPNKYSVILHNSVKRFDERGWIEFMEDFGKPCGFVLHEAYYQEKTKALILGGGIEVAESLILMRDINNKKKEV